MTFTSIISNTNHSRCQWVEGRRTVRKFETRANESSRRFGGRTSPDAKPSSRDASRADSPDSPTLKSEVAHKYRFGGPRGDWKNALISAIKSQLSAPVDVPDHIMHSFCRPRASANEVETQNSALVLTKQSASGKKRSRIIRVNLKDEQSEKPFVSHEQMDFFKVLNQLVFLIGACVFLRMADDNMLCVPTTSSLIRKLRSRKHKVFRRYEQTINNASSGLKPDEAEAQLKYSMKVSRDLARLAGKFHSYAPELQVEEWLVMKV